METVTREEFMAALAGRVALLDGDEVFYESICESFKAGDETCYVSGMVYWDKTISVHPSGITLFESVKSEFGRPCKACRSRLGKLQLDIYPNPNAKKESEEAGLRLVSDCFTLDHWLEVFSVDDVFKEASYKINLYKIGMVEEE